MRKRSMVAMELLAFVCQLEIVMINGFHQALSFNIPKYA